MALNEGQQQTLAQIGQASYKRASAEYEGEQPPVQPSTPEQQESGEYDPRQEEGTGVDLTQPKKFDEEGYEQSLREHGFTNRANERAASKVALEKEQLEFKVKDQQHKTETMLLGAQMMQTGFKEEGMAIFNGTLPEGQKIKDFKELPGNKARVFTEDQPEGFVTEIDGMVTMLTDANTQFSQREANRRAERRKIETPKTPLSKKATTADTKQLAISMKGATYDDIAPGASELSSNERTMFSRDILEKAYGLQAEAKQRGAVLDASEAREMAAQMLSKRITESEGFMGMFKSYSYKAPKGKGEGKKEVWESEGTDWTEVDKKNIQKLKTNNAHLKTMQDAETAYKGLKGK